MTDNHPITPLPELVREWNQNAIGTHFPPYGYSEYIATQAAHWCADQELEACCEVLARELICDGKHVATDLRAARRPKFLSLKKQALALLDDASDRLDAVHENTIRRALEQLND